MITRSLPGFPPNSNPFIHDAFHMGALIGRNVVVMMKNHRDQHCPYLIVVDTATGDRLRIDFLPGPPPTVPEVVDFSADPADPFAG